MKRPDSLTDSRRIRFLARLHPPAWRARYGDEFGALLVDTGAGPGSASTWSAPPQPGCDPAGILRPPPAMARAT